MIKIRLAVVGLVLALAGIVQAETLHAAAKYCNSIAWHMADAPTPGGDAEGNFWTVTLKEYRWFSDSTYFGMHNMCEQKVEWDDGAGLVYTTTFWPHTGPPSTHHDSFDFDLGVGTYTCNIPNSTVTITKSVKFYLRNQIYITPVNPINASPGGFLNCTIKIEALSTQPNCATLPFTPQWFDIWKNTTYTKNGTITVDAPNGNYEIQAYSVGKGL